MKQPQVIVWNDFYGDDLIIPIPDDLLLNIRDNKVNMHYYTPID